ncbi:MAG: ABC transporter ATP-binding protein [Thermomicrobiales bacterium]
MSENDLLLEIKDLKTHFFLHEGVSKAVDGVSFDIGRNRTVAVVGESGCGKSVTARSILQILDRGGKIVGGEILYHRKPREDQAVGLGETVDLVKLDPRGKELRAIRGHEIAMIFQEPMSSFSPIHTIGDQIGEAIQLHQQVDEAEARDRTVEMLRRVGIPRPAQQINAYPHQISGGMRQRAMIAMALSCKPSLLIADEPTTALDVTIQAQILDLLRELQQEYGMAIMLITHNLGVVAELADDVVVMYLGQVAEQASVDAIFHEPQHPYTQALLRSIPRIGVQTEKRLSTIRGSVPNPYDRPGGCVFHPRCPAYMPGVCNVQEPVLVATSEQHQTRCLLYGGR